MFEARVGTCFKKLLKDLVMFWIFVKIDILYNRVPLLLLAYVVRNKMICCVVRIKRLSISRYIEKFECYRLSSATEKNCLGGGRGKYTYTGV